MMLLKYFQQFITFIIKFRIAITSIIFALCCFSTYLIFSKIKIDNAITIWFLENDDVYKNYLDFQEKQGSDEIIVVMIPTSNVFSKAHLNKLRKLHQKIDTLDNVNSTYSLVKAQYPIFANNTMYLNAIINDNRSEKATQNILNKLPAIRDNLVAENNTKSFFYIQLKPLSKVDQIKDKLLIEIKQIINSELDDYKITGAPILVDEINKSVSKESVFFAIIITLLIIGILLIVLPRKIYLPIALVAVAVPVCLLFGLYVILGFKLNMISMLIPTILMVYTVSDVIHIISIYHSNLLKNTFKTSNELIINSLYQSLKPCFYTTLTTIIGYLALCVSPLPVFKVTGFFTFIGLLISFGFAYIITTIGFRFLQSDKSIASSKNNVKLTIPLFIAQKLNYVTSHYKKTILVSFSILLLAGIISIFDIEVNSYSIDLLHDGKAKKDLRAIEKTLKGTLRLSLDIYSADGSSLMNDKTLRLIDKFQQKITQEDDLATPVSVIDFKKFLEKRFGVHSSVKNVKLKPFDSQNKLFFKLVSDDFSRISINVNSISIGSKELGILLSSIRNSFNTVFNNDNNIILKINGSLPLYLKLHEYILVTQLRSFGTALLLSFLVLFYFIKKFRTSILALIPNLLPLLLTAMVMVALDIPLNASNAMIAPIMIGIAMDDTIHLIHKYKLYKSQGFSVTESMDKATIFTCRAVFSTTFTLVLGFSVLLFSRLTNMREFGLLCAVTIFFALIADALVLPALIKAFDK